jgi:hypothetical protein
MMNFDVEGDAKKVIKQFRESLVHKLITIIQFVKND